MNKKISVIGAGSMGSAVSTLLANNGHTVSMWSFLKEEVDMINTYREQKDKLPGVIIPETVTCTNDLADAINGAELIVFVIPSQTIRSNAREIAKLVKGNEVYACFSKGLEEGTGKRMSQVITEELGDVPVVAMSGPCHAEELGKGIPSAYVAACIEVKFAEYCQDIFMAKNFRVYTNPDIVGVELGGAIKNVIALCAGISDGLGYGDNTKAALMTRGLTEMTRLGVALGAQKQTFAGLAGIGDLIVTCTSMHSRNRRAGILLGQGKSLEETLAEVKMVVEGVTTTKATYELAKNMGISMPITTEAFNILFEGKNAKNAVYDLMMRDKKHEIEEVFETPLW